MLKITEIPHQGSVRIWVAANQTDFCARALDERADIDPDAPYSEVRERLRSDLRELRIDEVSDELYAALPRDVQLRDCEVMSYSALYAAYRVDAPGSGAPDATVLVLPGWAADDGNCEAEYRDADDGAEAAQRYVDDGDWVPSDKTSWVTVYAWREAVALAEVGETVYLRLDRDSHTIRLDPQEPECTADEHDWQSPYEVLGGLQENPGVWGNGGGVICKNVCAHCGAYRVTDTWAQHPETGEEGLTSIKYLDADEDSLAWVESSSEKTQ